MIRGVLLLALVVGLTVSARSFGGPDGAGPAGGSTVLAFGFLLLATLHTGLVFHALHLPHLTGFLVCGVVFGPEVLGVLTPAIVEDLGLVKRVAVGLIALHAGCELRFSALGAQLRAITAYTVTSVGLAWVALAGFFWVATSHLPGTQGMAPAERAAVAAICATCLAAFSPSVVLGIVSESRAAGPFTQLAVSIVVLADLLIVVAFAFVSAFAAGVFDGGGSTEATSGLAAHVFGSLAAGVVVGLVLAVFVRRVGQRIALFTFCVLFVVAQLGSVLHLDPLLVGLAAGLFLENVSPVSGHEVIHRTEAAALPTFAVFFGVIGAEIHLHAFLAVLPFATGAAAVRAASLWLGTRLGRPLAGADPRVAPLVPLALIPQAGVALALAAVVRTTFAPWGEAVAVVLVGTVVVNELVGPILFRIALWRAGELGRRPAAEPHDEDLPAASLPEPTIPPRASPGR